VFVVRLDIVRRNQPPSAIARGESGEWILARWREEDLDVALLWPSNVAPLPAGIMQWCGSATILGFDEDKYCLVMRVCNPVT
jgi:hypothetical protein